MNIKTATLLGMVGAIISIVLNFFYVLLNTEVIKLGPEDLGYERTEQIVRFVNVFSNLCSLFSAFTLALFFYVLYKNQK